MKIKKSILSISLILISFCSYSQWESLDPNLPNSDDWIDVISFVNADLGFANFNQNAGTAGIIKTEDGGASWSLSYSSPASLTALFALNENIIFSSNWDASLVKSVDGGANWTTISSTNPRATDMYFMDENNGVWVGDGAFVAKTTDGGANWNTIDISNFGDASFYIEDVEFLDENIGYLSGASTDTGNGLIAKTVDGGDTWELKYSIGGSKWITRVAIVDENIIYGYGNGIAVKSIDAGATWTELNLNINADDVFTHGLEFANENTGVITGLFGIILVTEDGGVTWEDQSFPFDYSNSLFSIDQKNGVFYTGGIDGKLWKNNLLLGVADHDFTGVTMYPNPVNSILNLSNTEGLSTIEIYNIIGQLVFETEEVNAPIHVNGFQNGIYFLKLNSSSNSSKTIKFIKE